MWINLKDEIRYGTYGPSAGNFGKIWGKIPKTGLKSVDDWIPCREVFHNINRNVKRFYYHHDLPKGHGRSIAVFFDKIETKLNLADEMKSRFGPTNKRKIMWIEMSEWWRCHSMRRSLFTALLRQSTFYRICQDNFEESLYHSWYIGHTKNALNYFLEGNTYYWGGYQGWVQAFSEGQSDISRLLRTYPRPHPPRRTQIII